MTSIPPPAEELRILDAELTLLDARRAQLLARRAWLVSVLQQSAPSASVPPASAPAASAPPRAVAQTWAPRQPEAAPHGVQNVLLTLGGILLAVAAIAFTVVSWGSMGIGGRSAVLATVTLAALVVPAVLLRRGLASTAEAIAAVGLLLTVLDAYALHAVALQDTDPMAYAAGAAAVLAALWIVYGLLLPALHLPLPAGVATAHLPLLLWSFAAGAGAHAMSAALLATTAAATLTALHVTRASARITAAVGATAFGLFATLTATGLVLDADSAPEAALASLHLLAAATIAFYAAWRSPRTDLATATAAAGTTALLLATGGILRAALPDDWAVVAQLLCATALSALVRSTLPRPVRRGLAAACAAVFALALAWTLPALTAAVAGPAARLDGVWTGAGERQPTPGSDGLAVVAVLVVVTGVLTAAYRLGGGRTWRPYPGVGATVAAWAALTVLPLALRLAHPAELTAHLVLATLALTATVLVARRTPQSGTLPLTTLVCFYASALTATLLALATEPATFTALGALLALTTAATAMHPRGIHQATLAVAAVAAATGLAVAIPAALGVPAHQAAFAVLAVPAATALLGARLRTEPYALPVELAGATAAGLAIILAATDAPALSLTLALAGVIAAGTALRADRRPAAAYTAGILFLLATWVRLAASDVTTPEAYTLPVTVPALVIGLLRRRRDPEASSWAAYGPGLAATLLPSLAASWNDEHWQRPLLLGSAALVITLLGAHHRLQAPLTLGGATLALVALHELAPYVVQVIGALPRWLPPAAAGLLLLAAGATYEQRLRDARRLRDLMGRMH
ncbi:SCO7613 C-terminal domain-containing membrane protein [Streptomyces sp. NPDC050418]|uniref:SCO7613 C-terminal domain-containing membrane protein n=1 Tax=Streptomyces sp. NPDC050418 TaxID=3365612 RepID=UPI00378873B8